MRMHHDGKKYVKLRLCFTRPGHTRVKVRGSSRFSPGRSCIMKRVLFLLGASPLFAGAALAKQRCIAVSAPPRTAVSAKSGLRVERRASAQVLDTTRARTVQIQGDALSLSPGDVVILPFLGVTRIITEDDEVARAFFQNGSPVLQALTLGTTTVEIYQATGTPRVLTISVAASQTATPSSSAVPTALPATIATPAPTPIPAATPGMSGQNSTLPRTPDPSNSPVESTPSGTIPSTTLQPDSPSDPSIVPAVSGLMVATRVIGAPDDPAQAQFSIEFSNASAAAAHGVLVRFPLDARVKLVPGSVTGGGTYDADKREVVWRVGDVPAHSGITSASLRVTPIERSAFTFDAAASIEDATGASPITSSQVRYSTSTTPLLTVFALPDRFLAGVSAPRFTDLDYGQSLTIERLKQLDIVRGVAPGQFAPLQATRRAEYAVMTLKSLNLRDLRELTQLKFVLSRRSTVSLSVQNAAGERVADLVRGTAFEAGEHTAMWNGKTSKGLAPTGRYTYICSAKDARGETTTLRGVVNVVNPNVISPDGLPTFVDVKASDWFARYLAAGEKQGLIFGFPDKTFRPLQSISRVEATAIVVRALGLSDAALKWADKDVGFLDYADIPVWARGDVNVATTIAKTGSGNSIMRGTTDNRFEPRSDLTRAQAAQIVSRLIDRETTRHLTISGSIVPGAVVSINSRPVSADSTGQFSFSLDMMTSTPTTLSVVDTRSNVY